MTETGGECGQGGGDKNKMPFAGQALLRSFTSD